MTQDEMHRPINRPYVTGWLLALAGVGLLYLLGHFLLLVFAGVLFSILLRACATWICQKTPLPRLASLAVVITLFFAFFVGFSVYFFPELSAQLGQLRTQIPQALDELQKSLEQYPWAKDLIPEMQGFSASLDGKTFSQVAGLLSTTLGILVSTIAVLFIGIYLAIEPNSYHRGILALIPKKSQKRFDEVLLETDSSLRWWLVGKLAAMAIIAVSTGIGLAIIGVPMAMILGLIAGLLSFIPNIGPIISALPAVLLAFTVSPQTVLYTVILYVVTQTIESYMITPFIQRRTILMPPVLILSAQFAFGVLFGFMGVLLATPIVATIIVFAKNFYVADYLKKDPKHYSPGS